MIKPSFPWETAIQYVKGVGPNRAFLFGKLDIQTLEDLLYFIPFRYEDRSRLKKIGEVCPGEIETVVGEVMAVSLTETARKRMKIVDLAISDSTGLIHAKWFNQPFLKTFFKKGDTVMLSGRVKKNFYGAYSLDMENPQYEKVDQNQNGDQLHVGRIVPVYHETKGISVKQIRTLVKQALDRYGSDIPEMMPTALLQKYRLCSLSEALFEIHFPSKGSDLERLNAGTSPAHRRLAFDELFLLEIGLALRQQGISQKEPGICFDVSESHLIPLRKLIPFCLTAAQERVLGEIKKDMVSAHPMHRLIQGDVGSGKTLIALMSLLIAIENGYQGALMAPTEILAEQHYLSLKPYLEPLGHETVLLTSDMKKRNKDAVLEQIASGASRLVIGTHALIEKAVQFKKLGLVVVDEQHKFGVLQRAKLVTKGRRTDLLIMTATPIPRTLAMTLYGDLNISVVDELPPGRSPIETKLYYAKQRDRVYRRVEKELAKGRQAFVVCPLVEESEKLDLKAAIEVFEHFKTSVFPNRTIGLLHGRLKRNEKEAIMKQFKAAEIDLLVATTVVEVGIDIPNATVMVIEHAERYGLSQLHQLRGRVGRGREQSACLMIAEYAISKEGKRRLQAMVQSSDGFKIAEEDLAIRGPGEFFGTKQSGLPTLKVANLVRDARMLETARAEAFAWVDLHPELKDSESLAIREHLERKWQGKLEWLTMA